jgi:hypothetical protein
LRRRCLLLFYHVYDRGYLHCIFCLSLISLCIFAGLLRLYYKWYAALSIEQWLERVKKEEEEWKREMREQAKQQREVTKQGMIRVGEIAGSEMRKRGESQVNGVCCCGGRH